MMTADLRTPYPWFGGKAAVADLVWSRFGNVKNYIEPFFGGGSMLLQRPQPFSGLETVNDINGWLCNFWRSLQADPDGVAHYADWPVSELDLHARGDWLFYRDGVDEFVERLRSDPDYYDVKSAGWWVWGQCCWIAGGWGRDPSRVHRSMGVHRQLPHLGNGGQGIHRQRPHLGDGMGVNRVSTTGESDGLREYMRGLAERLRGVRVCCGDWTRVCGSSPTVKQGLTAVFLDPPYAVADRDTDCYGADDDITIAHAVREWAIANGDDPRMRIALCGYEGEHEMPSTWLCEKWKANGYGRQRKSGVNENGSRERIWFSPHTLKPAQGDLFSF